MIRVRSLLLSAFALSTAALVIGAVALPRARSPHKREACEREAAQMPGDWFWAQRANPDGTIDPVRWEKALQQTKVERAFAARAMAATAAPLQWQSVGPVDVGGRVTALAVDAAHNVWLGAANGGVWKSTNAGVNWTCTTDAVGMMSVGALAVDPSTPGTIWCGTGESNGSVDSYDGNGLWRTSDSGASWEYMGLETTGRIARVVVDPANPNHVLVAAMGSQYSTSPDRGLYRTLDGGATWNRVLYVSDSTGVTDVVMNPTHPDTVYCATWCRVRRLTYRRMSGPESGIWRSIDRGATWTRLTNGLPTPTDSVGRIALAVAPSRPSLVYASITTGNNQGNAGLGFYRSTDGGDSWTQRTSGGSWSSNFGGFSWGFGNIGVDPANSDRVWQLGTALYSTSNGGTSFELLNADLHPDQRAIWIDPANGSHVYVGNDGGFWWSTTGTSFTQGTDLPISQFYDGDVSPANANDAYGGLQDNGTIQTSNVPRSWYASLGGDGFHVLVDPVTPSIVFQEFQNCSNGGGFRRSTTGGQSPGGTSGWVNTDRFGWDTPICINPLNHNLLLAASQFVYRSTNNGITWAKINGQDLTTNPVSQLRYGCITTVAISPADTNTYYTGSDDGKVWRSSDRGANWTDVSAGLPGRWVTRVVPDPVDPLAVYVTESGFTTDEQSALIYRSGDRGATWANVSANLPNVPANDLVVDPNDAQTIFLATDTGVWVSRNRGAGWSPLGTGLPLDPVFDLTLHNSTRQLFAFTHGRSAWSMSLSGLPAGVPLGALPPALALSAPWPNPARNAVRMALSLARDAIAEVTIYDALGRRVSTLHRGLLAAGRHDITWDGLSARGARARSGVYFVSARSEGAIRTQRVVLTD